MLQFMIIQGNTLVVQYNNAGEHKNGTFKMESSSLRRRNWWLQVVASITMRFANHRLDSFRYPEPIIITFIAYWQLLLMQREPPKCCSNNAILKHWVTCFHLGSITGCSGGDWLPYRYANHLVPDWSYYRYLLVFHW